MQRSREAERQRGKEVVWQRGREVERHWGRERDWDAKIQMGRKILPAGGAPLGFSDNICNSPLKLSPRATSAEK